MNLQSIAFGLISGFVGWMLSEFLAKPFRRGIDLKAEARTCTIVYGNVQARYRSVGRLGDGVAEVAGISDEAEVRLQLAEKTFRELGARMLAFADTEAAAYSLLRLLGTDLKEAGVAFIGLSNSIGVYGQQRADASSRVEKTLGVKSVG